MSDLIIQSSFNSGEWAPNLFARVDIAKYHSGAALLENFFVDYRGGASTRPGSIYCLQAYRSNHPVRVIAFRLSFAVEYVLEFGTDYIRFYYQGSPILENSYNITAITQANPCVITTSASTGWNVGDWIYIANVAGMKQIDQRYFTILAISGTSVTLGLLNGSNLDSTTFTAYTSGGTAARIYTLTTTYSGSDLALLKYTQTTNQMVLVHPNYSPQILSIISANDWTIGPLTIGSTISAPTGISVSTTLGAGTTNYAYIVTSIDDSGQESAPSTAANLTNVADIRTTPGSNRITWTPVTGAVGYNLYESEVSYFGVVPSGSYFGFIGTTTSTTFVDSNIGPDFSQGPPVVQNPFAGAGVAYVTITAYGTYTTVPTVTFGGSPTAAAVAEAVLGALNLPTITAGGTGYKVGDTINFNYDLVLTVTAVSAGVVTAWTEASPGTITSGSTPSNPLAQLSTSGTGSGATATVTWTVREVLIISNGAGYSSAPSVIFSSGSSTGTAVLQTTSNANPSVASFFQQRLVLAAPSGEPQTFYMSQPGLYFNFDVSNPTKSSDAISETLVSNTLQTIKSLVSSTSGMLALTDRGIWLVNGGSSGSAVAPTAIVANLQSSVGANDVPPIVANYDVLYVSSRGAAVRDLSYNIYFNVFTGTDISLIASHLFYGYTITGWAWAEQPFYVAWATRSDGVMLCLTYLKEQEFIAWTHQVTQGLYESVCSCTETTTDGSGTVDAVYTVVRRTVEGNTVQYIERIADRTFTNGLSSAWCVDAGISYNGPSTYNFSGAEHLAGLTVTGIATDNLGNVYLISPFTMPANGIFTLPMISPTPSPPAPDPTGYVSAIIGIGYTCQLQTLPIDIGQIPMQGKVKQLPDVTVRVKDTLGLTIGTTFTSQIAMKDLIQGNISSMLTGLPIQAVSGLYTGDARTILDAAYTVPGQFCIQQSNPYPATVLGVFPHLVMGETDEVR